MRPRCRRVRRTRPLIPFPLIRRCPMKRKAIAAMGLMLGALLGWTPAAGAVCGHRCGGDHPADHSSPAARECPSGRAAEPRAGPAGLLRDHGRARYATAPLRDNRNYLPATWAQLMGAQNGAGGAYGALGSDVTATMQRNAILTPANTQNFSAAENCAVDGAPVERSRSRNPSRGRSSRT